MLTKAEPVEINGSRSWLTVPDVGDDLDTHFPIVGEKFLQQAQVSQAKK